MDGAAVPLGQGYSAGPGGIPGRRENDMEKKFTGYGPGWNRCECGLPLRRTMADNLVHRYPIHGQRMHDLVMRKKAEAAARATG